MDPPRILHLIPREVRRGAEVFAAQLAAALQPASGNLLFPLFGPAEASLGGDVRVVRAAARPPGKLERATGVDPGAVARLREGLRRLRPDLVVAHGGEPLKYAVLADPRGAIPLVYRKISHATGARGERVLARMYSRPRLILAVSDGLADELVQRFGADRARIRVIPTSRVPPPELTRDERAALCERIGARADQPLLAWVGRLSEEKQPEVAIRALALIRSRHGPAALAMCGDGPLAPGIERAAGAVPGTLVLGARVDAPAIIAASDLLLSTSRTEGAPGVLVEAGLAGVPVVAFDVGEVAQIVRTGRTGLLVTAGDLEALADAAVRLLAHPEERAAMGAAARETCRPFSLQATLPRYAEAFADVLGRRGEALRTLVDPPRGGGDPPVS